MDYVPELRVIELLDLLHLLCSQLRKLCGPDVLFKLLRLESSYAVLDKASDGLWSVALIDMGIESSAALCGDVEAIRMSADVVTDRALALATVVDVSSVNEGDSAVVSSSRILMASSWSNGLPQRVPSCHVPRPISEIFLPVLPNTLSLI